MAIPSSDLIWADYNGDGSVHEPNKVDIRRWSRYIQTLAEAGVLAKGYSTKAAMDADTSQPDGTLGVIRADPNDSYNFPTLWVFSDATNTWDQGIDRIASLQATISTAFGFIGGLTINSLLRIVGAGYALDLEDSNYWWSFKDGSGNVALGCLKSDGKVYGNFAGISSGGSSADAVNLAKSEQVKGRLDTGIIGMSRANYSIILGYGQSRMFATEGWPALSKTAVPNLDNLMYGGSTRPTGVPTTTTTFDPVGGSGTLQPLIATVESGSGTLLNDAAVAALAPGSANPGEDPLVTAANYARRLDLRSRGLLRDQTHRWVAANASVPGLPIEALSKGATPNLFLRNTGAVTKIKALAAVGETTAVGAIVFNQGEFNYVTTFGGTTDKATYKALLLQLLDDLTNDTMAITGQADPPLILLVQTDSGYVKNNVNLGISMAQWEVSQERAHVVMIGGMYAYTDKNGHLDPNGYRWLGIKIGQVLHKVDRRGEGFRPLAPRAISNSGRTITLDYHVPEPPLRFGTPYVVLAATDYADKGFYVTDDLGVVSITGVSIVGNTQITVTVGRDLSTNPYIWYGDETHFGGGCVKDSDTWVTPDLYTYSAGTGQYAGANIPALVDKPYDPSNWGIIFKLPCTWSAS